MLEHARNTRKAYLMEGKCDEVRKAESANVRTYGQPQSLDFIEVAMGSHWRASHLSLHHLDDISL